MALTSEAVEECLRVLDTLYSDPDALASIDIEVRNRLMKAAGRVSRPERDQQRALSRAVRRKEKREIRDADRAVLARAGIRKKRLEPLFTNPELELRGEAGGGVFQLGAGGASAASA